MTAVLLFSTAFNQKGLVMKPLNSDEIAQVHGGYDRSLLPKPAVLEIPHPWQFRRVPIYPRPPKIPSEITE
jgi:hypothetical protein